MKKLTDKLFYVGASDNDLDLFEGQYEVPNGMAYNSYIIKDEKIAILDSVDAKVFDEWVKSGPRSCYAAWSCRSGRNNRYGNGSRHSGSDRMTCRSTRIPSSPDRYS